LPKNDAFNPEEYQPAENLEVILKSGKEIYIILYPRKMKMKKQKRIRTIRFRSKSLVMRI